MQRGEAAAAATQHPQQSVGLLHSRWFNLSPELKYSNLVTYIRVLLSSHYSSDYTYRLQLFHHPLLNIPLCLQQTTEGTATHRRQRSTQERCLKQIWSSRLSNETTACLNLRDLYYHTLNVFCINDTFGCLVFGTTLFFRDCAGLKKKYIFMIVCLWIYMLYCCCYVLPSLLSKCLQNYLSYMAVSDWTAHPVISANCWQRNLYFHRLKVKSCTLKQRLWRAFPSRRRLLQPRRFLSTSSLTLTLDNEN